jgi:hypothetical protein
MSGVLNIGAEGLANNPFCSPGVPPLPCLTIQQFRRSFPEFADSSVYLDEFVLPWLNLWSANINARRWGDFTAMGIMLAVAHQLALGRRSQQQASRGGAPGLGVGMLTSKAVASVSAGYDTASVALEGGGAWNLTTYGIQFLQFARMFGTGGIQIRGYDSWQVSEADLLNGINLGPLNTI